MPPKPKADGYTTEPVPVRERSRLGRFMDAIKEFKPPVPGGEVRTGELLIDGDKPHAERYSVALHNNALEQGYESELRRYRRPLSFTITIRRKGEEHPQFWSDMTLGEIGLPPTEGVFRG